jgi:hypothetical protein
MLLKNVLLFFFKTDELYKTSEYVADILTCEKFFFIKKIQENIIAKIEGAISSRSFKENSNIIIKN